MKFSTWCTFENGIIIKRCTHCVQDSIKSGVCVLSVMEIIILICGGFLLGFTPCKAEQPLQGMELQEKEA